MKISNIQVQGQQVTFNGSAQDARQLLTEIAASVTNGNAVKSGYLKLVSTTAKDGQQQFSVGLRWSKSSNGDTARSTGLVKALVQAGYGDQPEVTGALEAYLGKTNGKIGSQSLVRLVQTLVSSEAAARPGEQGLAQQHALSGVRVKAGARLDAQPFAETLTRRLRATEDSRAAVEAAQPDTVRALSQENFLAAPLECRRIIRLLETAIESSKAVGVSVSGLEERLQVMTTLLESYEPTETRLNEFLENPMTGFYRRAETAVNGAPRVLELRAKLSELTTQIEDMTSKIVNLGRGVANDSSASPATIRKFIGDSGDIEKKLVALRRDYLSLAGQLKTEVDVQLGNFALSWNNRTVGNQGFSDLPNTDEMGTQGEAMRQALQAARNAIVDHENSLASTAASKLDSGFKDWIAISEVLNKRNGEGAPTAKGRELLNALAAFATEQFQKLADGVSRQAAAEAEASKIGVDLPKDHFEGGLKGLPIPRLELGKEQLEKQQKVFQCAQATEAIRLQARDDIAGWLRKIMADPSNNGSLSKGDTKALQDTFADWDRTLQQTSTLLRGAAVTQTYDNPAAPQELSGSVPSWTYARGAGHAAVALSQSSDYFFAEGTSLQLTRSGARTEQSPEALSFFKGQAGRVCVLSAGLAPVSSGYAAANGDKENLQAYVPSVRARVDAHSEFGGSNWMPKVTGYTADDVGLKFVLEDLAPTSDGGTASLHSALTSASTFSKSVKRNVMAAHIADVAGGLADLHGKGWRVATPLGTTAVNFAIGADGQTKFLSLLDRSALPSSQRANVEGLAKMLIGWFGETEDGFLDNYFEKTGLRYGPLTPEEAFSIKIDHALGRAEPDSEDQNDSASVPPVDFESDPAARQLVYEKLNLKPFAGWIERALFRKDDDTPATAAELKALLLASQPEADTPESRAIMRRMAERCTASVWT